MGSDTDQTQLAVVWRSIGDPCLSALLVSALQCCSAANTHATQAFLGVSGRR
ncbi:hypothetical protein ACQR5V_16955 [Xanthomonas oryzae pv. oryzicola]|uniref:hypothetical protein n=1 Tax=Xanthomonas oryzae TaxID=347 RepID=UPI000AA7ECF9|nr:hypothetical protein [Xanthomonas oryzae]MEC5077699.1 hypothetical protein [Xanthomonas oryzae pv. oryzicola]MEC5112448.1 hypothetical protein [Xanthomonas oryzae pv. oryzicola]QEO97910.1 hypothetical protein XOCgx_2921 [Xanthomonas oryzae pv. oryzicola]UBB95091.1 hypothetical protein K2I41_13230 [Xanthomonas oryzae pv. oryzicola]ULX26500.1 hypothetical protein IYN96_12635 [Xanthomonas oryzae pv. oryzicola]